MLSCTKATLPVPGFIKFTEIWVSDGAADGGPCLAISDGKAWYAISLTKLGGSASIAVGGFVSTGTIGIDHK